MAFAKVGRRLAAKSALVSTSSFADPAGRKKIGFA